MKIALIPIYNEQPRLAEVLESVERWADYVVMVDDGSEDGSASLARAWAARRRGRAWLLCLGGNQGMGAALRAGFLHIAEGLEKGRWAPGDLVVLMDADGQYQNADPERLCGRLERYGYDMVVVRRDFSLYPWYKRMGNSLLSGWATWLCGRRYYDVEAGLKVLRAGVIPRLLEYFTGRRYSCAQEIGIITVLLGFKVDNDFLQPVSYYRSRTKISDFFINAGMGLLCSLRVRFRYQPRAR